MSKTNNRDTLPGADTNELLKFKTLIVLDLLKHQRRSVAPKPGFQKSTGMVSLMSFDGEEGITEQTSPYETFTQIVEGSATFIVDGKSNILGTGEAIMIPANISNYIKPNGRFKMLLTTIKSGYEE